MEKIRVGVIGCGGIANGKHLPALKNVKEVEMVAFCDIIEERAVEAAKKYGTPDAKVYTDYKELLKDESIVTVHVCTPNRSHSFISIDAMEAGKHVMCEKPMAKTYAEAKAMYETSVRTGKLLTIGYQSRWRDDALYLKQCCENGELGDVYYARAIALRRRAVPTWGVFLNEYEQGGGPLIDLGVHMIDLAIWLMGSPKPVTVTGSTYCKFADSDTSDSVNSDFGDKVSGGTFDVEDLAMGTIRFDNGAQLQIEFSWASNIKQENRFVELRGTKSGLTWRDGDVEVFTEMHGQGCDIHPSNLQPEKKEHVLNLINFYDVVIDGKEPVFKPQQGIDMIKILCAIYKSAETGREVVLD